MTLLEQFKQEGLLRDNGKMNASFIKKLKRNTAWLEQLESFPGESLSEKLYRLAGNEAGCCEVCGKPTAFRSFGEGYGRFCSTACSKLSMVRARRSAGAVGAANPVTRAKMQATCKARYGYTNPFQRKDLPRRSNPDKQKATLQERYGVDHPSAIPGLQERRVATWKANYTGKAKTIETNMQRYGVAWAQQSPEVIARIKETRYKHTFSHIITSQRFLERLTPMFSEADYKGQLVAMPYKCNCCGIVFEASFQDGKLPRCPTCYPVMASSSIEESELTRFVESILPEGVELIRGDTSILGGKELDMLIPSKKLAIEYNGNYWHSELSGSRGRGYHLDKTIVCENAGIRLLHIFSDEWIEKPTIVKSIIKSALGIRDITIGARKLEIVAAKSLALFYDNNHIQGRANSSVNLALVDKTSKEVLAGLSFKKPRYAKEADWEITRFAVKCGYSIPGAFSRLLKAFRAEHSGSIVTYSERRLFSGSVYSQNGFQARKPSPPAYWYTRDYQSRENRMRYQKHLLEHAQPELSEWENMQLRGYDRIWDCGCWKFMLTA